MTHTSHPRLHLLAHAATLALAAMTAAPAKAVVFTWNTGTFMAGVTAPSPLAAADVLNIGAGGFKYFDGSVSNFSNGGTVNWNADPLYFQSGAVVTNNGLWNATGNDQMIYNGGAATSFTNNGTLRKSAGVGSTTINGGVGFVNNGTLNAQTGSIAFVGGSVFNAGSVFSGAGVVGMNAGSNTFNGSFTSSNLLLAGGTHLGNGAVVGGAVALTGGTLSGTWGIAAGQTLNGVTGGFKYMDGAATVVTNSGTVAWNTTDLLYLQSGATLRNQALFVANQNTSVVYNGGVAPTFENTATGTVRAAAGVTLNLSSGVGFVNNAGVLDAAATGAIRYNGATFNAATQFTGAGSNVAAGNNSFNGSYTSANLVLQSGAHSGGGAVMNGSTAWSGGTLGGTWTVAAGQTLSGQTGGFKYIDGAATVVTNLGTIAWNSTDLLYLQSSGALSNQGLFVANQNTSVVYNGGAAPVFNNTASGTVRAAAGVALGIGSGAGFVNNGGTLDAQAAASINYAGGSVFNSGTQFTGAGSNLATGNNTFNGAFTSANLVLQSGNHLGNNAAIAGALTVFSGGTLNGNWQVSGGQVLNARTGGFKYIDGAATVVTNLGTLAWDTSDLLYLQSAGTLNNQGLFVANQNMSVAYNGGAATVFNNTASGTVRAATGVALGIGAGAGFVNNAGVLNAQTGGSITYSGGSVFNAGTQFTGAGSNVAAGNNTWNGGFNSANLELQSGVHTGNSAVVNGTARLAGGTLGGTWEVGTAQTLVVGNGGFKYIDGSTAVVTNKGLVAVNTNDLLYMQSSATLANQGTLNFSGNGGVVYNGGTLPSFVNSGLIVKSGGAGVTTIGDSLAFNNLGTVDVQTGTIALPTNFTNNGTLKGVGSYSAGGTLSNAGTVAPGASPGTLGLTGNYAQTGAGIFAVDLQSMATHDLFNISGTAALGGTLAINCFAACSLAVGDVVTILDSVGVLSGTFASVSLSGFATGAFNVIYDTVADRVQLQVTQGVTAAVPEPGTYALWLAGLGLLGGVARRRRG